MSATRVRRSRAANGSPPTQLQVDYFNDCARERRFPIITHFPAGMSMWDADQAIDMLKQLPVDETVEPFERAARGEPATKQQQNFLKALARKTGEQLACEPEEMLKHEASSEITRLKALARAVR